MSKQEFVRSGLSDCNTVDEVKDRLMSSAKEHDIETVHITLEDNYMCYYGYRETEHKKELPEGAKILKGSDTYTQREQFARRVNLCDYLDEYAKDKVKRKKVNKKRQKEADDKMIKDMLKGYAESQK